LTLVSFKGRILISLKGEGWAVDGDGIALNERPVAVRLNDGDVLNIARVRVPILKDRQSEIRVTVSKFREFDWIYVFSDRKVVGGERWK